MEGNKYKSHSLNHVYDEWWRDKVWMLDLDDIIYNDNTIKKSNVTHAVLNSNSPFIYIEKDDFNEFTAQVSKHAPGIDCTINEGSYCVSMNDTCDTFYSQLKNLEFSIDGTKYVIPPEGYSETDNNQGYACMLWISHRSEVETIELGTAFLQNFVTSYEYRSAKVNFGLNVNAPVGAKIISPDGPDKPSSSAKKFLIIALIVILILVLIVAAWCIFDKKRQRDLETKSALYAHVQPTVVAPSAPTRSIDDNSGGGMLDGERRNSVGGYSKGQERLNLLEKHN